MLDDVRAEIALIHRKLDGLLLAVHHLLTRDLTMAASHADVLAALDANDGALLGLAGKVKTLVQSSAEASVASGAAYDDILARVTGQGNAVAQLDEVVTSVLPGAPVAKLVPVNAAPAVAPDEAAPVVSLTVPAA